MVLVVPAFLAFASLALVDIALTILLGTMRGVADGAMGSVKMIAVTAAGMVCGGAALGANGCAVFRELSGEDAGLGAILRGTWRRIAPLSMGTFLYHLLVLVPAIPGLALLGWSILLSMEQRVPAAMGCILAGGLLLYYPLRLFLQMILFAFVVSEEGKGGWAALLRSRELMRMQGAGGISANHMFRIFVVLHVSLMPALVVLLMACIPVVMMVVVYSWDQLADDIAGHHLSPPYLILQILNVIVMTLIVPMFVVPLAVVYQDIRRRVG